VNTSTVAWNGAALATSFVSGTKLTAKVPSSDLTSTAVGLVTVSSPAPGGGTSGRLVIEVTTLGAQTSSTNIGTGATGVGGASGTAGSVNAHTNSGSGMLVVARYASAPANPTFLNPESGAYFDVYLAPGFTAGSATIVDCALAGGNTAYFQDPVTGNWLRASVQTYAASPTPCLTITVTGTTFPSLSQLNATPFGIGNTPALPAGTTQFVSASGSTGSTARYVSFEVSTQVGTCAGTQGLCTLDYRDFAAPDGFFVNYYGTAGSFTAPGSAASKPSPCSNTRPHAPWCTLVIDAIIMTSAGHAQISGHFINQGINYYFIIAVTQGSSYTGSFQITSQTPTGTYYGPSVAVTSSVR
jgi:hypothetical protein